MAAGRGRQDGCHTSPHRAEPEQADADGHSLGGINLSILEINWLGLGGGRQGLGLGLHQPQDVEKAVGP